MSRDILHWSMCQWAHYYFSTFLWRCHPLRVLALWEEEEGVLLPPLPIPHPTGGLKDSLLPHGRENWNSGNCNQYYLIQLGSCSVSSWHPPFLLCSLFIIIPWEFPFVIVNSVMPCNQRGILLPPASLSSLKGEVFNLYYLGCLPIPVLVLSSVLGFCLFVCFLQHSRVGSFLTTKLEGFKHK